MKKNFNIACLILIGLYLTITGCGSGSGGIACAPGSDEGDTGVCIRSVSVTGEEPAGGDDEIDVHIHYCPPEFTEVEDGLFMANATLTINATYFGFDPLSASVEECTITYLKGNENLEGPVIENLTVYPNCPIVSGENTCTFVLMDVDRKTQFWEDFLTLNLNDAYPYSYPWHYIADINCIYISGDETGTFQVEYDFWLADWDYC